MCSHFIGVYVAPERSTHVLGAALDCGGGGVGFDADSVVVGGGGGGGRSLCPWSPLLYDDDKDCFCCPTLASENHYWFVDSRYCHIVSN